MLLLIILLTFSLCYVLYIYDYTKKQKFNQGILIIPYKSYLVKYNTVENILNRIKPNKTMLIKASYTLGETNLVTKAAQ